MTSDPAQDPHSIRSEHDFLTRRVPLSSGASHVFTSPPVRPADDPMVR